VTLWFWGCMCVSSTCSSLTSVIYLYHIQSMPWSKLRRTALRILMLAGLKHGGATNLIVSIVTAFNYFVRLQGIAAIMHSQFLTVVILRMQNFWVVMLCRCVIHSRIFEDTRIFRTAGIYLSNKKNSQNWRYESFECSLLLSVTFSDFVLTFIHLSQLSRYNIF